MGSKGAAKGAKPLERLGGKLRGRLACEESPDPRCLWAKRMPPTPDGHTYARASVSEPKVCAQGPPAPDIVGEKTDGSKVGLSQCGGRHSTVGLVARRK